MFLLYFQQVMNLSAINSTVVFWRVCLRRNSILSGTAYIAANGFTESVAWGWNFERSTLVAKILRN
jgi:hypothetical protein